MTLLEQWLNTFPLIEDDDITAIYSKKVRDVSKDEVNRLVRWTLDHDIPTVDTSSRTTTAKGDIDPDRISHYVDPQAPNAQFQLEEYALYWIVVAGKSSHVVTGYFTAFLNSLKSISSGSTPFEWIRNLASTSSPEEQHTEMGNILQAKAKNKAGKDIALVHPSAASDVRSRGIGVAKLIQLCHKHAITPQRDKAIGMWDIAHSGIDLTKATFEDLNGIKYVGPKTASCYLLHHRQGTELAGLDTQVMKFIFKNIDVIAQKHPLVAQLLTKMSGGEFGTPPQKKYLSVQVALNDIRKALFPDATPPQFDLAVWKVMSNFGTFNKNARKPTPMKTESSINTRTDTYAGKGGKHLPVPRDENGLYTVDFLKSQGVDIIHSEVKEETHRVMNTGEKYTQRMRVDTFTNSPFSPKICLFYGETRGPKNGVSQGILPISDKMNSARNFLEHLAMGGGTQAPPDDEVDATEIIAVRSDARHVVLVRPDDVDIVLRYFQEVGFVCASKEVKVPKEVLDHYAIDVSQL